MEIMSESDSDRLSVNRFFRAETYDNVQNIIDYFFQAVIQSNSCEENIESLRNVDDLKFSLFFLSTFDQNFQGYHGFLQCLLSKYKEANSDLACSAFIFKDEFHTCIQKNFMQIYVLFIDAVETIWKIKTMKIL